MRHFEKHQHGTTPPRKKRRTVVTKRYRRTCVKVCRQLKKQNPEGTTISHVARVVTSSHGGSRQSVTRALDLQGYGKIRKERDVGLTPTHVKKRLIFACKLLKWSDAKLARIVFTDEKLFTCSLGSRENHYVDKRGAKKLRQSPRQKKVFWGERYHGILSLQLMSVTCFPSSQITPSHLHAAVDVFHDGCGFLMPEINRASSYSCGRHASLTFAARRICAFESVSSIM